MGSGIMRKGLAGPREWRTSCIWPWLWTCVKPQGAVHFRWISLLLIHYVFKTKYIEIPVILFLWCVMFFLSSIRPSPHTSLWLTRADFQQVFDFYEGQVHLGHYGRFLNKTFQKRMTINKKIEWNQPCCYLSPWLYLFSWTSIIISSLESRNHRVWLLLCSIPVEEVQFFFLMLSHISNRFRNIYIYYKITGRITIL